MQKVSKIILLICCFIQTPKFLFSQTNKINSHGSSLQKSSPGAHKVPSEVSYTTLGTQKWMTENLDVTHFRNGDSIPQALNKEEWIRLLIERKPAWCYFNFLDNQYGKIYNFHALLDKRGLTPNGWRIPIQGDINMLINFLGDYAGSPKSVDFESLVAQNVIIDNIHASLVVKGTNKLGFNLNKSAFVVYNKETLKDVVFVPEITFWSFLEPFTDEEINMVKRNLPNERLIQKAKITRFRNSGTGVQVGSSLVDWSINGSAVRCIKTEGLYGLQLDDGRVMSNGKWGRVNINGEIVIPLIYQEIGNTECIGQCITPIKINGKYGWLDKNYKELIKPVYDSIWFARRRGYTNIYLKKNGVTQIGTLRHDSPDIVNEADFITIAVDPPSVVNTNSSTKNNSSVQNKSTSNASQSKPSDEISYVRLGDIDVLTSDLGEMTYDDAKDAIKNLGEGWRLPNEKELKLMFNSQDKIGTLSKREYKIVQDYWIYGGNYLGEESNGQLVLLRTLIDPGYTITFNKSGVDKRSLKYIRAVRGEPAAKATKNSNQSVGYDFSELKSQGCDVIKSEFKQFAIQYINYRKRVKSNPYSLRIREDTDWENNLRKISDLATTCAIKLKGDYALDVFGYMNKVSSLMPIEPIIPSSSKNNSSVQNKSTSNTSQSKPTQTNNTEQKRVDMSTEVLSQIVSCKTCRNPVTIQKNVPRSPEFKKSFNEIGSITSSMCQKCNKTSLFTIEIRNAEFVKIN